MSAREAVEYKVVKGIVHFYLFKYGQEFDIVIELDVVMMVFLFFYDPVSLRLIAITGKDVQDGMWCVDTDTGLPGIISSVKRSVTSCCFDFRTLINGASKTRHVKLDETIYRPIMQLYKYLVSHLDGEGMIIYIIYMMH